MRSILARALSVGPLTLPNWVVVFILSVAAAAVLARFLQAVPKDERGRAADIVLNAGTIWLLVWKLTPVLLRPGMTLRDPLAVVATPGGTVGGALGTAAVAVYLVVTWLRRPPSRQFVIQVVAGVVGGTATFFLATAVLGVVFSVQPAGEERTAAFTLPSLHGEAVSLEAYSGRTVILNFWATWCPPCRGEIPDLVEFHENLEDEDVVLLSVNQTLSETGEDAVRRFAEEFDITYPILLDRRGLVSASFGVRGIPTTFVIGPDGRIEERAFGAVSSAWLNRWR